jgi:hypothetical protein
MNLFASPVEEIDAYITVKIEQFLLSGERTDVFQQNYASEQSE